MSTESVEDPNQAEKTRLRQLLNDTHSLRLHIKNTSPSTQSIDKLKDLAEQCLSLSNALSMEHGKGLSLEMLFTAKLMALEATGRGGAATSAYAELEGGFLEANKIAISYQDKHLETRILEGLANVYRRSDQHEKEINIIEKAITLGRTVPKVLALLDAYHRVINFLYEKMPDNTDAIVKANTEYWSHYLWLKEQPEFNHDQFILQKKVLLYKIAVYIGSIAGSPFNLGEANPDDHKIALEAYDEAIYIATVMKNYEFLCAAHAHKALALTSRITVAEKQQLLQNLKDLEDTYRPQNDELGEMIKVLEKQLSPPLQETGR